MEEIEKIEKEKNIYAEKIEKFSAPLRKYLKPLVKLKNNLTAYDFFALTVLAMVIGHIIYFMFPSEDWLRLPDRLFLPVFLVSVGYNAGHRPSPLLWIGTILICLSDFFLMEVFLIRTIGTILLIKYSIEPLMTWCIKNTERFWIVMTILAFVSPMADLYVEYGTLGFVLAAAGWLNKNKSLPEVQKISIPAFFCFALISYMWLTIVFFPFTPIEFVIIAVGNMVTLYLLYNMKTLLLNSIRNKPKTIFQKTRRYIGHKSLEIYVIHMIILELLRFSLLGPLHE